MWQQYFAQYHYIFGIDKETGFESKADRVHIFKGDQSDAEFLKDMLSQVASKIAGHVKSNVPSRSLLFDLIVDDGSHVPSHQIMSFISLVVTILECIATFLPSNFVALH